MGSEEILDRIDALCEEPAVAKELKAELSKDHAIKAMFKIYELDEIARINPIEVYNALEKSKLSKGAKEFRDLCFKLADTAHAEAARQRLALGLEGGED